MRQYVTIPNRTWTQVPGTNIYVYQTTGINRSVSIKDGIITFHDTALWQVKYCDMNVLRIPDGKI